MCLYQWYSLEFFKNIGDMQQRMSVSIKEFVDLDINVCALFPYESQNW